ncbi:MAG: protein kinase [Proteobacteria bacterium]|nr:protein kinase [Pseudomonadota bacterium]
MHLAAGTQLDRYVVLGPLGQGGMGTVLRVRHQRLGTLHALKVLHGGSPNLRARLLREGQLQGNLRHTHVVSVTDVIDVDGMPGLVMEYVDGPDLARLLAARPLTLDEADAIARPILDAVVAAHHAGLVHRDLKPANVLLAIENEHLIPKVADFGLAKALDDIPGAHKTRSGMAMGTPAYMAPEQIRDASSVDERADVFALGCVLYELVTGQTAFTGADSFELMNRVVRSEYQDVRSLRPMLPENLVQAIHGALESDPDERIPTVEALRALWTEDRPQPHPDWQALVTQARGLADPAAEAGTWSGGDNPTWQGSIAEPTSIPQSTLPIPDTAPPHTWSRWVVGVVAVVASVGLLMRASTSPTPPEAEPAVLPVQVLTSESVVTVSDDAVVQQQFAEGWQALLDADFRTAERKLEVVTATDPPDPSAWFVLAVSRLARDDVPGGVQAVWTGMEKSKSHDSPFARLLPHTVRIAIAEGWDSEHGQAQFDYLEDNPSDYLVPLLPLYSPASNDAPEWVVQRMFEAALARDPRPAAPYALHASGRLSRGLWSDAIQVADLGLVQAPSSPPLLARKGSALLHSGEFEEAKAVLLQATQEDPGLIEAQIDLAQAAWVSNDIPLYEELHGRITGPLTPIAQLGTYAIEMGGTLVGQEAYDAALTLLQDTEVTARQAGDFALAFELVGQQGKLYQLKGDLDAFDDSRERLQQVSSAPELAPESRQRFTETLLLWEAWLAVERGDFEPGREIRDRLADLPDSNPRNVEWIDHWLAVAEKRPEDLKPALFEEACSPRIRFALDLHRAGGDATAALQATADDLTCSAIGRDPLLQSRAAEALSN